jgi:trehalose-phosphatase
MSLAHGLSTVSELCRARHLFIFLDYDGTLTPIVSRPEDAQASSDVLQAVAQLGTRFPTSIVTGRNLATIRHFLRDSAHSVNIAASHGFHIAFCGDAAGEEKVVGQEFTPFLSAAFELISRKMHEYKGAMVENNGFSISVHYRNLVPTETADAVAREIEEFLDAVIKQNFIGKLKKTHGKKVYEIRPDLDWHKGRAVKYLLDEICVLKGIQREHVSTVYIGDDVTDEDAFEVLHSAEDYTYLVSNTERPSKAKYQLSDPDEVLLFIQKLLSHSRIQS